MTFRLAVLVLTLSVAAGGCTTTTAHRLPFADNPMREQALACETKCRPLATPSGKDQYAACLDGCPGAVATKSATCPAPPAPGVICVETEAIALWPLLVVAGLVVLSILLISSLHTAFSFA